MKICALTACLLLVSAAALADAPRTPAVPGEASAKEQAGPSLKVSAPKTLPFSAKGEGMESLDILPPPTAIGSVRFLDDEARYREGLIERRGPRGELAVKDADLRRMAESFSMSRIPNSDGKGFLVSYAMMRSLYLTIGDDIRITFLKPGKTATIVPYATSMTVDGYYSSRMSEFSNSTLFMDYDELAAIIGEEGARIGIYLSGSQSKVIKQIQSLDPEAEILTWQEYNKAIYSALMLEKTLMYVFLAFMFLIICVNLKNSTKRLLVNKQREGAMLRALGCSRRRVNLIFLMQGMIVCLCGEILGIVAGKIVIANLSGILSLVDKAVRLLTGRATVLMQVPLNAAVGNWEIAVVCLFVFAISLLFTSIGCRRIHRKEIMEVILHASY